MIIQARAMEEQLKQVMSLGGEEATHSAFLRQLEVKGSFDCLAHPPLSFCTCPAAMDMPVQYDANTKNDFGLHVQDS